MPGRQVRAAVRLIVMSGDERVLLLRYERQDGAGPSFWVPPGGAIEPGESHRCAAKRELNEETGLHTEIASELWDVDFEFDLDGKPVRQFEKYFLVRVDAPEQDLHNSSPEPIAEHRWWTFDELEITGDTIYPDDLLDRLRKGIPERS